MGMQSVLANAIRPSGKEYWPVLVISQKEGSGCFGMVLLTDAAVRRVIAEGVSPPTFCSTLLSAEEGRPSARSATLAHTTSASVELTTIDVCFLMRRNQEYGGC